MHGAGRPCAGAAPGQEPWRAPVRNEAASLSNYGEQDRRRDLGEMAREQLQPYIADDADRLRISGDSVLLPADIATPFGLVLHELATNAAKYGALSRRKGTVALGWIVKPGNDERIVTVVWE